MGKIYPKECSSGSTDKAVHDGGVQHTLAPSKHPNVDPRPHHPGALHCTHQKLLGFLIIVHFKFQQLLPLLFQEIQAALDFLLGNKARRYYHFVAFPY